ncbi:MAG: OPT/YSL family transporter [Myxococcales bacterium]|nr:OPT/YSL family transporter [Myxococcales bacterium]
MSALPGSESPETESTFPIDTSPLSDPEQIAARDRQWLERVYARGEAQLTVRAAVTGMILGGVLGASNLYIGLKIGWNFGMSITASVLAFAIFSAVNKVFPGSREFSMLENNTSQTAASAAAYMSSAGLVSSIPALTMLRADGTISIPELTGWRLTAWLLAISVLGVVVAIPLKRNLINAEQLRFPSGIVCAETIRTMHAAGKESIAKARSLLYGGLGAAALKFIFECKLWVFRNLPETVGLPGTVRGLPAAAWSFSLNTSLLLYAAGAIIGMKVALSLVAGGLINFGVLGPWLLDHNVLRIAPPEVARDPAQWRGFVRAAEAVHAIPVRSVEGLHATLRSKWSVWAGTSLMVTSSLVAFGFRWRTIARAFSGLGRVFNRNAKVVEDPLAEVEVPQSWFVVGLAVCGVLTVLMQKAWFDVPVLEGILSVVLAFVLSIVAARATGETDVTPIGAMGKITQLTFGVLVPGNAAANLMTATVTAGAASHSADLLTEVKTGYLLGGAPRKQFWAQVLGVFAGAFACVWAYGVIARPERLGRELAAPAAVAWASVAKLLKDGPQNLPQFALTAIVVGASVGAVLAVLEELAPRRVKQWLPSATGLGIGMVLDLNDSLAMLVGALVALYLQKRHKALAERYIVSVSSGMVAGEGLMGIVVIVLRDVLHWLPEG